MATKGARRRRERRAKRKEARKLRQEGPKQQFYGGSEKAYKEYADQAAEGVDEADDRYTESADKLGASGELAARRERQADNDYEASMSREKAARGDFRSAISGIQSGAATAAGIRSAASQQAIDTRNAALAANDLNRAADAGIIANNAVAQQRLAQQSGFLNRSARGLAGSMGEGGALAMQQALAGAGQGAADLAAQNAVQQSQMANDMRYAAAQQQVANALNIADVNAASQAGVGDANAAMTFDAAGAVADQTGRLRDQDQNLAAAVSDRQKAFLGSSVDTSQIGSALALDARGQQLGNQQTIEGAQLGVNVQDAQNRFNAANNRGFNAFLKKTAGAFSGIKDVANSADMGPTKTLMGSQ